MSAWYSPLTNDTMWEYECPDGFSEWGIMGGNTEDYFCPGV